MPAAVRGFVRPEHKLMQVPRVWDVGKEGQASQVWRIHSHRRVGSSSSSTQHKAWRAEWAVNTFVCYSLGKERARIPFSASLEGYLIPAGTADSLGFRAQQRKSSRKSREKRGFPRAVPNLSGVLTPLLPFRTGKPAP